MMRLALAMLAALFLASVARAQTTPPPDAPAATVSDSAAVEQPAESSLAIDSGAPSIDPAPEPEEAWEFELALSIYAVADDEDYAQPTLSIDKGSLHLEARYNYESLDTSSFFVGWTFSFGEEITLDVTPMIGAVVGDLDGVAPGYLLDFTWGPLNLYSEGEAFFDSHGGDDDYLYTWSELSWSFTDWLRAGLVAQRTRAYDTDLDIQRGVLVGVTYERVDIAAYIMNLGWEEPTFVLTVSLSF